MKRISFVPDSRFKVRMREITRRSLRLFGGRSERDIEYDFAYRNIVGNRLYILDIGGCDSLLPLTLARQGHKVTVYDFRPYPERHPNLTVLQGDFLENQLPPCSFNVIVMVSTIEHIGFGGYGDPEFKDADFNVMRNLHRILLNGVKVILTFPFNERERERNKERIIPQFERWYTPERCKKLFEGWYKVDIEFWVPEKKIFGRWVKWKPATMRQAAEAYKKLGMHGLACFALSKEPQEWYGR